LKRPFFKREFASCLEGMDEPRKSAVQALLDGGWIKPHQAFYARLCIEEALVNAVQHGNRCDPCRKVYIEMDAEGDECLICVRDEGQGFEPGGFEFPECHAARGRGLALIHHCMDHVEYDKTRRCLEMRFRRKHLCNGGH